MATKTKLILQYIFGILLLFCSLIMLAEGNKGIIGSLFMIIIGLICIPKTRQLIEQKFNFRFSKPIKYIAIIFGWFSISILLKPTTSSENSINTLVLSSSEENVTTVSKDTIITSSVSENRNQEIVKKSEKTQSYLPKQKSNKKTEYKYNKTPSRKPKKNKNNGYGNSYTSGKSGYITGPRGGCYYINSNGNKVYVDHSYCH